MLVQYDSRPVNPIFLIKISLKSFQTGPINEQKVYINLETFCSFYRPGLKRFLQDFNEKYIYILVILLLVQSKSKQNLH